MTVSRALRTAAAAAATVLTFFGPLADVASAASAPQQASKLIDDVVVDARGRRLGVTSDVVIDWEKAQVVGIEVSRATAAGTERHVYLLSDLQFGDNKIVVRSGAAPIEARTETRLFTKVQQLPLRDAQGKKAGDITDVMFGDDSKVTGVVIQFDPSWLELGALAAVPTSSIDLKDDAAIVKFSSDHVRPAGAAKAAAPVAPKPPPPAPRARLTALLGASIVDANGAPVATIEDALIDTNARRVVALSVRGAPVTFPQAGLRFDAGKLVATGSIDALAKSTASATSARRLLQGRMINPKGDPVGKLEDVVVDMANGNVQFAVASFDPTWVAAGWLVALPLRGVAADASGQPTMRADLTQINHAFIFEAARWPDITNEAVRAAIHAKIDHM